MLYKEDRKPQWVELQAANNGYPKADIVAIPLDMPIESFPISNIYEQLRPKTTSEGMYLPLSTKLVPYCDHFSFSGRHGCNL